MFHLTPDHKYLVWFSQTKSSEETRIRINEIPKIVIGSESKVVEKTKKADVHETSFTILYGKANNEKHWKSLTVTAKNEKEAFVWAQGQPQDKEDSADPLGRRKHFAKMQSVMNLCDVSCNIELETYRTISLHSLPRSSFKR